MKLFFLFFLSISTAFSQVKEQFYNEFGLPIDSLILGEWELEKVEIVNGFYHIEDSNRLVSQNFINHRLSFTADSMINYIDTVERFYHHIIYYTYEIEKNKFNNGLKLNVKERKNFPDKKKKKEMSSYIHSIIECNDENLVLLHHIDTNDGLASPTVSYLYTYKKPTKSNAIDSLFTGVKWYFCSDMNQYFLSENETQTFEFQKVDTNNLIDCPKHEINIEFIQSENSKELACSSSTRKLFVIDGLVYSNSKYRIDIQNKLLYVLNMDVYVYNILLVNENQLTLVLNKSLTNKLNQRRKKNKF